VKQLNEFDTLAEAQAYTYIDEKMASPDMVLSLLTEYDSTLILESKSYTDPKAKGFMMALNGSVSEYNVMNSHPVGQAQQALLGYLVSIDAVTQEFSDALIAYANQEKQPYEFTTQAEFDLNQIEEYLLPDSTADKTYTLSITSSAPKATQVKIMQQVGNDENDLTEWHQVGQFSNVHYKQYKYKARIPATDLAIRKLKLVSDYTLGLSVE